MRSWADIRFESLAANLTALSRRLPSGAGLLLPVKADAYGHGAIPIARWAEELGVGWLGVATVTEALELRAAGVRARLLLFGPLPGAAAPDLRAARITPTLCTLDEARRWAEVAPGAAAHVEIDTGMGRAGFDWRDERGLAALARIGGLALEGAYTHFPAADVEPAFTLEQERRFQRVLADLAGRGLRFRLLHLANSAALLRHPDMAAGLARPGIAAYGAGRATGADPATLAELSPVLRWWAPVLQLRDFVPGDTVGYGRTFRIERPTRAALLGVGYGDGYPRSQSPDGWVELAGARCPLLGRISMDLCVVDVSAAPEARIGAAALVLGDAPGLSADDLAERSGTLSYEILTGIRRRVERRYVRPAAEPEQPRSGRASHMPATAVAGDVSGAALRGRAQEAG